jgi:hypothetical protein
VLVVVEVLAPVTVTFEGTGVDEDGVGQAIVSFTWRLSVIVFGIRAVPSSKAWAPVVFVQIEFLPSYN